MDEEFYWGRLRRPHRVPNQLPRFEQQLGQEQLVEEDSSSEDSSSVKEHLPEPWSWPDQDCLREKFSTIDNDDYSKISWEALYDHSNHNSQGTIEWYPAHDIIEGFLFLFYVKKNMHVTEDILQNVIYMLLSLQEHGIIHPEFAIPYSAKTVIRLKEKVPQVPIRVLLFFFILAQCTRGFYVVFLGHFFGM